MRSASRALRLAATARQALASPASGITRRANPSPQSPTVNTAKALASMPQQQQPNLKEQLYSQIDALLALGIFTVGVSVLFSGKLNKTRNKPAIDDVLAKFATTRKEVLELVADKAKNFDIARAIGVRPGAADATEEQKTEWKKEVIGSEGYGELSRELKDFAVSYVVQTLQNAQGKNENISDRKPIHLIVCGTTGSGKSTLVDAYTTSKDSLNDKALSSKLGEFNKGNTLIFKDPFSFGTLFDALSKSKATDYRRDKHKDEFWKIRPIGSAIIETARDTFNAKASAQQDHVYDRFEEGTLDAAEGTETYKEIMARLQKSKDDGFELVIIGFDVPLKDKLAAKKTVDLSVAQSHKDFADTWTKLADIADEAFLVQRPQQISRQAGDIGAIKPRLDAELLKGVKVIMHKSKTDTSELPEYQRFKDGVKIDPADEVAKYNASQAKTR